MVLLKSEKKNCTLVNERLWMIDLLNLNGRRYLSRLEFLSRPEFPLSVWGKICYVSLENKTCQGGSPTCENNIYGPNSTSKNDKHDNSCLSCTSDELNGSNDTFSPSWIRYLSHWNNTKTEKPITLNQPRYSGKVSPIITDRVAVHGRVTDP